MKHTIHSLLLASVFAGVAGLAYAQELAPLNSDTEPDRIDWSELEAQFGPVPAPPEGTKIGDALWKGEEIDEARRGQVVGLFRLDVAPRVGASPRLRNGARSTPWP